MILFTSSTVRRPRLVFTSVRCFWWSLFKKHLWFLRCGYSFHVCYLVNLIIIQSTALKTFKLWLLTLLLSQIASRQPVYIMYSRHYSNCPSITYLAIISEINKRSDTPITKLDKIIHARENILLDNMFYRHHFTENCVHSQVLVVEGWGGAWRQTSRQGHPWPLKIDAWARESFNGGSWETPRALNTRRMNTTHRYRPITLTHNIRLFYMKLQISVNNTNFSFNISENFLYSIWQQKRIAYVFSDTYEQSISWRFSILFIVLSVLWVLHANLWRMMDEAYI